MTEDRWLVTNTPLEMIAYLAGQVSERKFRLFACTACRRILHMMRYQGSRKAVEIGERYADGQADGLELQLIATDAQQWADSAERLQTPGWNAARSSALVVSEEALEAAQRAARCAADTILVHEHFKNPFRPLLLAVPWLSWNDAVVVRLAQAAYEERILPAGILDNTCLLILADALEEAGCTDGQILTHLRDGGEHYRGCWVIDLLLGKQ